MTRNYITVAFRQLRKNKTYVLINTLGMGIAMACCLTGYLLIAYNLEFDHYFRDKDVSSIAKVMVHSESSEGRQRQSLAGPAVLGPQVLQDLAGVEDFTRFCNTQVTVSYGGIAFHENVRFADADFFKLFPLDLTAGSHPGFQNLDAIYLSEALATKYFGHDDPVGKTLTIEINRKHYERTVAGVLKRLPLNTSFYIEALLRIETYLDAYDVKPDDWSTQHEAALLLKLTDIRQRGSVGKLMEKYSRIVNEKQIETKITSMELLPFMTSTNKDDVEHTELRLPISSIPLFIFGVLGFIILLIACFNLTNTTLALTGKRMKEIGIRKVAGSSRWQIAFQFFTEVVVTVSLSVIAGFLMAQLVVPKFAEMWQLEFGLQDLSGANLLVSMLLLLFTAAILAGIYPALRSSRLNPVTLFKGNATMKGTTPLTRMLLVVQFSLSVLMLIGGIVLTQNARFQKTISFGYDVENVLTVYVQGEREFDRLQNSVSGSTAIRNISGAVNPIGPYSMYYETVRLDTTTFKTNVHNVGANYFNTIGLPLLAGRDFEPGSQADAEGSVIVDQNFADHHGLAGALDTQLQYNMKAYHVIGVVENHLSGLKRETSEEHIYFMALPATYAAMVVNAEEGELTHAREALEKNWKEIYPDKAFEYATQEDVVYEEANAYNKNLSEIFFFLTLLGCVLSASGIYALATLNVQRRTKEIGVRKVLGASVASIIRLLNRDFAWVLAAAGVMGGTGGYFVTNMLMDSLYKQHIQAGIVTVMGCCLLVFVVGLFTTTGTIFKTALTNPTETLRND